MRLQGHPSTAGTSSRRPSFFVANRCNTPGLSNEPLVVTYKPQDQQSRMAPMNAFHIERNDWIKKIQECSQCIFGIVLLTALVPVLLISLWLFVTGE